MSTVQVAAKHGYLTCRVAGSARRDVMSLMAATT